MIELSETAKAVQRLVATLEEKKAEVDKCVSDLSRAKIALEAAQKVLGNVRRQFVVELSKLDNGCLESLGRLPVESCVREVSRGD